MRQRAKLFIHGVPDTPAVWAPLIAALNGISPEHIHTPALPGFTAPPPQGFVPDKEAYTDWLIRHIRTLHENHGPIDIVGHDWGALLTLRAASLHPELIHSWTVSGAVIHPAYRGHITARRWSTPLLGELVMMLTSPALIRKELIKEGLPKEIAAEEASHWNKPKRQCILGLYRSAKGLRFTGDWVSDLRNLPAKGLVLWGAGDPYVEAHYGESFAKAQNVPFYVEDTSGHWMIAQTPAFAARYLNALWAG